MEIKHVKASEFNNEVLKSDKPVLVDFWADWCGPCKMLGPVLEQVAAKVDDVQIVKINVDEGDYYNSANDISASEWEFVISKAQAPSNKPTNPAIPVPWSCNCLLYTSPSPRDCS